MQPLVVIDVVGLSMRQVGVRTPNLVRLAKDGCGAPMRTILPAVTCSAQATMLTGLAPSVHGAVGNGWYMRETGEAALWRQANALLSGEKLYEAVKRLDPAATTAKIFWWWNMGAAVDLAVTPRPFYPADGRKIPAIYAAPTEYGLELERELGPFPFFDFWGPKSGLPSSRWLADATIRTLRGKRPTLTMVYLPHLDYDHQRFGPDHPRSLAALEEVDRLVGDIRTAAEEMGAATLVVSEYSLEDATRPVHINRALREAGLAAVRRTPQGEVFDPFQSRAFAVSDHQVAHVHAKDARALDEARAVARGLPGVAEVLEGPSRAAAGLDHPRAGDLVLVAEKGAWFTYYHWLDEAAAPDFARTVDIHRKHGYDPCELFLDPALPAPKLRIALRLLQKKLGMRYLMDVIPLDASLVKGTHGRIDPDPARQAVFLASRPWSECGGEPREGTVAMAETKARALALLARAR